NDRCLPPAPPPQRAAIQRRAQGPRTEAPGRFVHLDTALDQAPAKGDQRGFAKRRGRGVQAVEHRLPVLANTQPSSIPPLASSTTRSPYDGYRASGKVGSRCAHRV